MSLTTLALRSGNALTRLADRLVRREAAALNTLTNMSTPIDALPCPECRYGTHNPPHHRHAPTCSLINLETARHYAQQAEERIDKESKRASAAWRNAHLWEGKFHVLRHENNKLRKENKVLNHLLYPIGKDEPKKPTP